VGSSRTQPTLGKGGKGEPPQQQQLRHSQTTSLCFWRSKKKRGLALGPERGEGSILIIFRNRRTRGEEPYPTGPHLKKKKKVGEHEARPETSGKIEPEPPKGGYRRGKKKRCPSCTVKGKKGPRGWGNPGQKRRLLLFVERKKEKMAGRISRAGKKGRGKRD